MSHTLTIRLSDELLAWLVAKGEIAPYRGVPLGSLAREPLESAKSRGGKQRLLRHAGVICGGPAELSPKGLFPFPKGIADPGFRVALARSNDEHDRSLFRCGKGNYRTSADLRSGPGRSRLSRGIDPYVPAVIDAGLLRLAFDSSKNLVDLRELAPPRPIANRIWPGGV
jgi:hypothetical protein